MKSMHHSKHYPGTVFAVIMALEKNSSNFVWRSIELKKIAFGAEPSGVKYYWILYRPF